jgi:hypothetical protein
MKTLLKSKNKFLSAILALVMAATLFGVTAYAGLGPAALTTAAAANSSASEVKAVLAEVLPQLQGSYNENPQLGSIGGDWVVLGVARGGLELSDTKTKYLGKLNALLTEKGLDGITENRYTEYSQIVLALTALGVDAGTHTVGGVTYDFVPKLTDYDKVVLQGLNGPLYALLALDSKPYAAAETVIRQQYVRYILDEELAGGGWGWAFFGDDPDPDLTGAVLQALAKYRGTEGVDAAIARALEVLKEIQDPESGGFSSFGEYNAESSAQIVVALTELGIDPTGGEYAKNGGNPLTALLAFYDEEGRGFKHTLDGDVNAMTTEQAAYALVAYDRFAAGQTSLYNMADAFNGGADVAGKTALNEAIAKALALTAADYTAASWNELQTALSAAQDLAAEDEATQAEVNAAAANLESAIRALVAVTDKTALNSAITAAKSKSEADYTAVSWSGLRTALSTAEAVAADPSATQEAVNAAQSALQAAISALVGVSGNGSGNSDADTITVTFSLTGDSKHGENGVHSPQVWIAQKQVTLPKGSTVKTVTDQQLNTAGISFYSRDGGNYIEWLMIPGTDTKLGEFDNGPRSGWIYRHNAAVFASVGYADRLLSNGDTVQWFYTDDYTKESGYEDEGSWLSDGNDAPGSTTGGASINNTPAPTVSAVDGTVALDFTLLGGNATLTLPESVIAEIIAQSEATALLDVSGVSGATGVTLPAEALDQLADAGLAVAVSLPDGSITLSPAAAGSIARQADGAAITIEIKQISASELNASQREAVGDAPIFAISVKSGDSYLTNFNGALVAITLPYTLKNGGDTAADEADNVVVWYLDGDGSLESISSVYDEESQTVHFTTNHLSLYAIGIQANAGGESGDSAENGDVEIIEADGLVPGGAMEPDGGSGSYTGSAYGDSGGAELTIADGGVPLGELPKTGGTPFPLWLWLGSGVLLLLALSSFWGKPYPFQR